MRIIIEIEAEENKDLKDFLKDVLNANKSIVAHWQPMLKAKVISIGEKNEGRD